MKTPKPPTTSRKKVTRRGDQPARKCGSDAVAEMETEVDDDDGRRAVRR